MAHINTYKLKVAFRLYGKHYNLLTTEERTQRRMSELGF